MQAPGEDAAGSPPSAARQDRKRSLPRHRGGIKHRKAAKKPPPPPSSAPCPFGCGCWFREKCSYCHPAEDIELWQKERAAKATLIDISAARKKARLDGRVARRSVLSPLCNNTKSATDNTGAAGKEDKEGCDGAETAVVNALVQHPRVSQPTPEQWEGAPRTNRREHCTRVFDMIKQSPGETVKANLLPKYFTHLLNASEKLRSEGTGWIEWMANPLETSSTSDLYIQLIPLEPHTHIVDPMGKVALSLQDLCADKAHISFEYETWHGTVEQMKLDSGLYFAH